MYRRLIAFLLGIVLMATCGLPNKLMAAEMSDSNIVVDYTIQQQIENGKVKLTIPFTLKRKSSTGKYVNLEIFIGEEKVRNIKQKLDSGTVYKDEIEYFVNDSNEPEIEFRITGKYGSKENNLDKTFSKSQSIELLIVSELTPMIQNRGLRILEIQPGESFKLDDSKKKYIAQLCGVDSSQITLEQMSMTRFIADINQVNGKYDIVYIGSGTGSKATLNGSNRTYTEKYCVSLNEMIKVVGVPRYSTDKSNSTEKYSGIDITKLKADEIIEMIESGQTVVFDKVIFESSYSHTNIHQLFKTYYDKNELLTVSNMTSNTLSTEMKKDLTTIFDTYKSKAKRAFLKVDQAYQNSNETADYLSLNYMIHDYNGVNKSMEARLYLDTNGNGKYDKDEVVTAAINSEVQDGIEAVFNVRVPEGASGYLQWKVEVWINSDSSKNVVKSYQTGTLKYKPKTQTIRILHIRPDKDGSFRLEANLGTLLTDLKDYKFNITEMTMSEFQSMYAGVIGAPEPSKLNGVYDMIIFGFKDMYPDITSQAARDDIESFIDKGQSIMFTHDSLSFPDDGTGWAEEMTQQFREILGQYSYEPKLSTNSYKYTNYRLAGVGGSQKTSITKQINEGQITQYPYNLGNVLNEINVSDTHSQYYQLDMENPDIVVWYTLKDGVYHWNDPRNAYYTYSIGNLTFCGTGHSNVSAANKEYEKKLFVNTMVKAIKSANMPPQVEILDIENEQLVLIDQDIDFKIQGTDSDVTDTTLDYEYIVYSDTVTKDNTTVRGEQKGVDNGYRLPIKLTVNQVDTLAGENESLYIYAKATDKKGAYTEKTIKVKRVTQPLQVTQNFDQEGYLKGDTAVITRDLSKKFNEGSVSNVVVDSTLNESHNILSAFEKISSILPSNQAGWQNVAKKIDSITMNTVGKNELRTELSYDFNQNLGEKATTITTVNVVESSIAIAVKDELGRPIKDATITVDGRNYVTDNFGLALVKGLKTGDYTVKLNTLSGYEIMNSNTQNASLSYQKNGKPNYEKELEFIVNGSPITNVILKGIDKTGIEVSTLTVGEGVDNMEAILQFTNGVALNYQEIPILAIINNTQHNSAYSYQLTEVRNAEGLLTDGFKINGNTLVYEKDTDQLPLGTYKAKLKVNFNKNLEINNQKIQVTQVKIKENAMGDLYTYKASTSIILNRDITPPDIAAAYNGKALKAINVVAKLDGTGSEIVEARWRAGNQSIENMRTSGDISELKASIGSTGYNSSYILCDEGVSVEASGKDVKWTNFAVSQGGVYTIYTRDINGGECIKRIIISVDMESIELPNIS